MAWDDTARRGHSRMCMRYPGDLTDREWALVAPLLPPAKSGGRPRTTSLREVVNAIFHIASGGCQWRMLSKEFPPVSTIRHCFYDWRELIVSDTLGLLAGNSATRSIAEAIGRYFILNTPSLPKD